MPVPILNKKLTLEAPLRTPDGAGGFDVTWQALGTLWASVDVRAGRERRAGERTVSSVAYIFTVRAAAPGAPSRPEPEQRFRDGARIFTILSVTEDEESDRYLTCWTEEGSRA